MHKYEIAKQRYLQGESIKKIARDLHMAPELLSNYLKLQGIQLRGYSSTTKDWSEYLPRIIELRQQGLSIRKIHEITKVPRHKISYLLKLHNETTENLSCHEYYEDVFDVIDTEEKAYWLGFLYADGYVGKTNNTVQLTLHTDDVDHLRKFAEFIGNDVPVYSHHSSANANRVVITNKRIHDALLDKGCVNNKSLTLQFPSPEQVPPHLIYHFIRGYFDGDGGLYIETQKNPSQTKSLLFHITGTYQFLQKVAEIFNVDNKFNRESKNGNVFTLRVKGNAKPLEILDKLYENATVYLKRKYQIYQAFKYQSQMPS